MTGGHSTSIQAGASVSAWANLAQAKLSTPKLQWTTQLAHVSPEFDPQSQQILSTNCKVCSVPSSDQCPHCTQRSPPFLDHPQKGQCMIQTQSSPN